MKTATPSRFNTPEILSTLWIFAVVNYLYCDLMGVMDSNLLKQFLEGNVGGIATTPTFFLAAAFLMEVSMSMILLARVLPYGINRPANLIAGGFTTLVQVGTLFMGTPPTSYYLFFSIVENAATVAVVLIAWRWQRTHAVLANPAPAGVADHSL